MRFIKGLCSLISFFLILFGTFGCVVYWVNGLGIISPTGLIMIVLGLGINCLFSMKENGNKVLAAKYFFLNGAKFFCYMTIVLIPLGRIIKNKLPSSFGSGLKGNSVTAKGKNTMQTPADSLSSKQKVEIRVFLELEEFEDWE